MSHAANLRNREQALQAASPSSKRRKPSPSSSSTVPKSNGLPSFTNGSSVITDKTLSALPSRNVKSSQKTADTAAQHIRDGVQLTNGDGQRGDVDMEDAASGDSDSDSDSSSNNDDEDDDDEDEDEDTADSEAEQKDTSKATAQKGIQSKVQVQQKTQQTATKSGDSDSESEGDDGPNKLQKKPHDMQLDSSATQQAQDTNSTEPDAGEEEGGPSFGDLLRQRAPETIDVEAEMAQDADNFSKNKFDNVSRNKHLSTPTAASLGTVLTQALRTNDVDLLETCLQMQNLDSIRATIERLHSPLSTILLQRLAERLHRRPGRAGSLMVWVQWTVVAHGGYLATQPAAMKEIRTLYYVVKQRASALQPLLALKGKLDLLEAQLQLRRSMQSRGKTGNSEQDAEAVVYVEGEESSSDDEGDEGDGLAAIKRPIKRRSDFPLDDGNDADAVLADMDEEDDELDEDDDEEDDEEEDMAEYGLEEEDSDDDDMLDDEAEESENDSDDEDRFADENEIEYDEDDDNVSDESSDDEDGAAGGAAATERRPQKRSKLSGRI